MSPEGSPKLQHEAFGEIPSNAAHNESSRDLPSENELSWTAGAEVSYDTQWGDEEGSQSWSEATPQQGVRSDSHSPLPRACGSPSGTPLRKWANPKMESPVLVRAFRPLKLAEIRLMRTREKRIGQISSRLPSSSQ